MKTLILVFFIVIFFAEAGFGQAADQAPTTTVTPFLLETHSRAEAVFRSVVVPGWGQFYIHQELKGYIFIGTQALFISGYLVMNQNYNNKYSEYSVEQNPARAQDLFNGVESAKRLRDAFGYAIMGLESLFEIGSELRYKISRYIAILLGEDENSSSKIFKEMKALYEKRSRIAHGGTSSVSMEQITILRHYLRECIKEVFFVGNAGKALCDLLDPLGFGQRPWRDRKKLL